MLFKIVVEIVKSVDPTPSGCGAALIRSLNYYAPSNSMMAYFLLLSSVVMVGFEFTEVKSNLLKAKCTDTYSGRMTELNSSIANVMRLRTFPKKYKHLNIVLRTFQSRIRNWKRAFRKFGKFEERSSKFLEIRKLEVISNE